MEHGVVYVRSTSMYEVRSMESNHRLNHLREPRSNSHLTSNVNINNQTRRHAQLPYQTSFLIYLFLCYYYYYYY